VSWQNCPGPFAMAEPGFFIGLREPASPLLVAERGLFVCVLQTVMTPTPPATPSLPSDRPREKLQ
jgi:hypothetical protein